MSVAKNAVRNVVNNATGAVHRSSPAPAQPAAPPPREEREIESWLGELRGTAPANGPAAQPPRPSAEPTRAMPEQRARQQNPPQPGNEPTTAIPAQRPRPQQNADATTAIPTQRQPDPEAATEKLNTREDDEPKRRGGSGVSAADLLRREGRL
jgi:trehalose monomycolate/heme transporter